MSVKRIFIDNLPDSYFVVLKNIESLMFGKKMTYTARNGQIQVVDRDINWTTHRSRAHLYSAGFEHRGNSIGKSYLLENIDFLDGDTVIDCGANMGDLQLWFGNRNLKVNYLGIEPNPLDFSCLSKNVTTMQKPMNIALWDESSELKFWIDSKSASSSLIEPPTYTEIITVRSFRLDELELPEEIKLLKVEGEGAEPEILYGAKNVLPRIQWVTADVGPERGVEQTSTRDDVVAFLLENNFEIHLENKFHRKIILFRNRKFSET